MRKILFLFLISIPAFSFADTDYDAVVISSYPTAQKNVNYQIVYTPYDNKPFFLFWKVNTSTPDITALVNAYATSPAKSTLDTKIAQLLSKLGLTAAEIQTLKAALK